MKYKPIRSAVALALVLIFSLATLTSCGAMKEGFKSPGPTTSSSQSTSQSSPTSKKPSMKKPNKKPADQNPDNNTNEQTIGTSGSAESSNAD